MRGSLQAAAALSSMSGRREWCTSSNNERRLSTSSGGDAEKSSGHSSSQDEAHAFALSGRSQLVLAKKPLSPHPCMADLQALWDVSKIWGMCQRRLGHITACPKLGEHCPSPPSVRPSYHPPPISVPACPQRGKVVEIIRDSTMSH